MNPILQTCSKQYAKRPSYYIDILAKGLVQLSIP